MVSGSRRAPGLASKQSTITCITAPGKSAQSSTNPGSCNTTCWAARTVKSRRFTASLTFPVGRFLLMDLPANVDGFSVGIARGAYADAVHHHSHPDIAPVSRLVALHDAGPFIRVQ